MSNAMIYRMRDGDKVIEGTAAEIAEASGYCRAMVNQIVNGTSKSSRGIEIEVISRGATKAENWRQDPGFDAKWEKHIAPFKKVEWVPEGTEGAKKLRGK